MYFFTYFGKKTAMQIDQHSKYGKQVLQRHFGNVNPSTLGCVILPKVLVFIYDVDFPIPLPMNKSPSEKKSNLFHF